MDGEGVSISGSGNSKDSRVSRPFVVAAVVLVFAGSLAGSWWMMSLFGVALPFVDARVFSLHRVFQMDGFLTLLIMGIGYMIVPRFRNIPLPSTGLAYLSFFLVGASIVAAVVAPFIGAGIGPAGIAAARLAGVAIFAGMVFWMMRTRPRLLGLADWFIAASVAVLLALSALQAAGATPVHSLAAAQAWLLFPVLMVFGVEYKTMPSFLGFIRPRKRAGDAAAALAAAAGVLAVASSHLYVPHFAFNFVLLVCAALFAHSTFVFGGFDNSEILRLISGEKKARYIYTASYARLSFLFLFVGTAFAVALSLWSAGGAFTFVAYDLAIHYTAIGFIGTTIALYLPLMLPPITGRAVHFVRFSHAPVLLLVASLLIRAAGDVAIATGLAQAPGSYVFAASGWLVVAALGAFVVMVHRSMQQTQEKQPRP